MFIAIVFVVAACFTSASALGCVKCNEAKCGENIKCPGGLVKDICNCCYVCAKQEGEKCGGLWGMLGKCDEGLVCDVKVGKNRFHRKGICIADVRGYNLNEALKRCKYISACRKACRYGFKPPKKDSCHVCDCWRHAKQLSESCGGKYNMNGVCDESLKCVKNKCRRA